MTPATVHHGLAEHTPAERARVLDAAYARTPERFVRRPPTPPALPAAAWIKKPNTDQDRSLNPNTDRLNRLDRFRPCTRAS
jgi:putative transposase